MKKYFYILMGIAALMAAVSCNKEQDGLIDDENPGNPEPEVTLVVPDNVPTTLKASYVDTKTDYDADAKFSWTTGGDGDVVYLIFYKPADNSQGWVPYRATSKEADGTAIFTIEDGDYSSLSTYTNSGVAVYGGKAGGKHVARPYNFGTESYSLYKPDGGHTASYDPFLTLQTDLTGAASEVVLLGTGVGTTDASGTYSSYQFYTACAILRVTITNIPAEAKELRLCTNDKVNWPLDGDFVIPYIKDDSKDLEVKHDCYRQYYYSGGYCDSSTYYIKAAVSERPSQTFYFNVPTGTYPTGTLSLKLVDDDDNELLTKSINQNVTFNRNDMMYVTFDNDWTTLGTAKYADYWLQGKMGVIEELWDVTVQKSLTTRTYRILNPYAKGVNMTQTGDHDDYLYFTINDDSSIEFTNHLTGVMDGTYDVQLYYNSSTTQTKVFAGTKDDPEIVQIAPVYRDETEAYKYSRHLRNYMIRIVMPDYVDKYVSTATKTGDSGNGNFSYTTAGSGTKTIFFISNKSYPKYIYDAGDNDINPVAGTFSGTFFSNKTDNNSITYSGSNMAGQGFLSGPLYLCWLTYTGSYSPAYMMGSKKFYFLTPTDADNLIGTFTTEGVVNNIGSYAKNLVLALSTDCAKGNIMLTTIFGRVYTDGNCGTGTPLYSIFNNGDTSLTFNDCYPDKYFFYHNWHKFYIGETTDVLTQDQAYSTKSNPTFTIDSGLNCSNTLVFYYDANLAYIWGSNLTFTK